jgi:squalene-hopene/tetraprenyl-beta-curcumene cyclase
VTTLSINALAAAGEEKQYSFGGWGQDWLFDCQFRDYHPYTGAEPGGWGWTDLPGSVPDADDTPGALLALEHFFTPDYKLHPILWPSAVGLGVNWLLRIQNGDGGWPTFCRGWGTLPFDRSGSDLTAHTVRALAAWLKHLPSSLRLSVGPEARPNFSCCFSPRDVSAAVENGLGYLSRHQRPDGSWLPLWFGCQHAPDDENPTYGTARVLAAYRDLDMMDTEPARRGVAWLLSAQNADGGWGGAHNTPSSVEETALAVEVLLATPQAAEVERGLTWLIERVEAGGLYDPTPIGFYFAKLWYYEKLYPIIFSVAALGRARRQLLKNVPQR